MDELPPRELRYDMADELLEACFALWDCWDEDTLLLDKAAGGWSMRQGRVTPITRASGSDARAADHSAQPAGAAGDHAGGLVRTRAGVRGALGGG